MKKLLSLDVDIKNVFNTVYVGFGKGKPQHFNREFHGLCYYPCANTIFEFSDKTSVETKPNSIIYLPKGSTYTVHDLNTDKNTRGCYAINFNISQVGAFRPYCVNIKNFTHMERLFVSAEKAWRQKAFGYNTKCKGILYEIFYLMQKEVYGEYIPHSKKSKLAPAIDYIHNRYLEEEIRISYLAEMCNMSETYFRKLFLESFNISPIKYINSLKIAHAKELLQSNMYNSIGIISQLSGFTDENYFRKVFKQITSLSPGEFRKQL
ncbi:MAG: helix-turn-helix transcriptional regulator [Clostridia bacterium]|nr:helix-turn-helix transcriptional regulator [Clostridia bacterium]